MIEQHFSGWDYYAVKELEDMCRVMPEKVLEALKQGQGEQPPDEDQLERERSYE